MGNQLGRRNQKHIEILDWKMICLIFFVVVVGKKNFKTNHKEKKRKKKEWKVEEEKEEMIIIRNWIRFNSQSTINSGCIPKNVSPWFRFDYAILISFRQRLRGISHSTCDFPLTSCSNPHSNSNIWSKWIVHHGRIGLEEGRCRRRLSERLSGRPLAAEGHVTRDVTGADGGGRPSVVCGSGAISQSNWISFLWRPALSNISFEKWSIVILIFFFKLDSIVVASAWNMMRMNLFFFVFVFLFFDFVLFVVFGWFRHATPAICYSPLAFISGVITGYGRRRKIKEEVINEIKPNTWNECTCVCVCVCVCVCSSYKQTAMPDVENADAFNWSKKRQPTVMCYAILQFLLTGDFPMQIRPATQSGGSGESKYANFISENRSSSLLNGSRFQRNFLKKFKEDKLNWWEWAERKCGNAVRRTET